MLLLIMVVVVMMMMKIMESSSNHHRNEPINESTWIIMQHYEVTMGTLTPPLLLELAPENCYSTPQRSHLCAQSMVLSSACISPGRTGYTLWQGKITFIDDLPIWMPHLHRISHCHVWLPEGILSHRKTLCSLQNSLVLFESIGLEFRAILSRCPKQLRGLT